LCPGLLIIRVGRIGRLEELLGLAPTDFRHSASAVDLGIQLAEEGEDLLVGGLLEVLVAEQFFVGHHSLPPSSERVLSEPY
jgi:hypothetical protein